MENKYKLLENSKLILINKGELTGIYQRKDIVNYQKSILDIINEKTLYLEELPLTKEGDAELFTIKENDKDNYVAYFIEVYFKGFPKLKADKINMKSIPEKLNSTYYLYQNMNNELGLLNKKTKEIINLEKVLKESLKHNNLTITNLELINLESDKNTNLYELIIEIEKIETLHIYLNLENKLEIYKIFSSEMCGGKEYELVNDNLKYIDLNKFCKELSNHSLMKEIKYIKEYEEYNKEKQRKNIKKKILEKI